MSAFNQLQSLDTGRPVPVSGGDLLKSGDSVAKSDVVVAGKVAKKIAPKLIGENKYLKYLTMGLFFLTVLLFGYDYIMDAVDWIVGARNNDLKRHLGFTMKSMKRNVGKGVMVLISFVSLHFYTKSLKFEKVVAQPQKKVSNL